MVVKKNITKKKIIKKKIIKKKVIKGGELTELITVPYNYFKSIYDDYTLGKNKRISDERSRNFQSQGHIPIQYQPMTRTY